MKIGLLLPRSVLYPAINFDIVDGLKAALKQYGMPDAEFISASIGVAAKDDDVNLRCEQMILEEADVVVAYVNPHTAEYIHPLFATSNKLLLVLDSGFHFPSPDTKLSHAVYISLQGNLCCRIAARLAATEGCKEMAYACSFYDAGYRSSFAFHTGLEESGGSVQYNHVTALRRADFTIQPLLENMQTKELKGVLASFCGDMAEDFYREAAAIGLFEKFKVFGSPYMAEELWLGRFQYPGGDLTAVVPWGRMLNNHENDQFQQVLNKPGKANIFSLVAWEAGMMIAGLKTGTGDEQLKELIDTSWNSPRGIIKVNTDTHQLEAPVYRAAVVKDEENGNCRLALGEPVSFIQEERDRLQRDIDGFEGTSNSWFNAYPCLES